MSNKTCNQDDDRSSTSADEEAKARITKLKLECESLAQQSSKGSRLIE